MPDNAKKGITVKVAAELHAEVSEYVRSHGMRNLCISQPEVRNFLTVMKWTR